MATSGIVHKMSDKEMFGRAISLNPAGANETSDTCFAFAREMVVASLNRSVLLVLSATQAPLRYDPLCTHLYKFLRRVCEATESDGLPVPLN